MTQAEMFLQSLKNPYVMAPITCQMSLHNGEITEDECNFYKRRTRDVGLVISGSAYVSENGKGFEGELGVHCDEMIFGLKKLAQAMKSNGAKAILQIFHSGNRGNSIILRGQKAKAPSPVAALPFEKEVPEELTTPEILQIIEDFKTATKRAIAAGFDGVEIHGANGFLLQQFFSPYFNLRQDDWGGTAEKRLHFIKQVVEGVFSVVAKEKPDFIVGYRFSPEELLTPGLRLADTKLLLQTLKKFPFSYLHISLKNYQQTPQDNPGETILAAISEEVAGSIPLIGCGNVWQLSDLQKVGKNCQLVAVGQGLIFDPDFFFKLTHNKEKEIRQSLWLEEARRLDISSGIWEDLKHRCPEKLRI